MMPIELQSALIEICDGPYIYDALDYIHKAIKKRLVDGEIYKSWLTILEKEKGEEDDN